MARLLVARPGQEAVAGPFVLLCVTSPRISRKSVRYFMKTPLAQGPRVRYLILTHTRFNGLNR